MWRLRKGNVEADTAGTSAEEYASGIDDEEEVDGNEGIDEVLAVRELVKGLVPNLGEGQQLEALKQLQEIMDTDNDSDGEDEEEEVSNDKEDAYGYDNHKNGSPTSKLPQAEHKKYRKARILNPRPYSYAHEQRRRHTITEVRRASTHGMGSTSDGNSSCQPFLREDEAELMVVLRSAKLLHGGACLVGQQIYLKLDTHAYSHKTASFTASGFTSVACHEVCHFPIRRMHVNESTILTMRIKSALSLASTTAVLTRVRPTLASVHIQLEEFVSMGSPDNFVTVSIADQMEVEMAFYWCPIKDVPHETSAQLRRNLRKNLRMPRVRGVLSPRDKLRAMALGIDDVRKDEAWVDNPGGLMHPEAYNKLTVVVIQAEGLIAADATGRSDPYCNVMCHGRRFRTKFIRATLNPVWEEAFEFPRLDNINLDDELCLVIRDKDKWSRDDDLGQVNIPLWALSQAGLSEPQWYTLSHTNRMNHSRYNSYLGRIYVQVIFEAATSHLKQPVSLNSQEHSTSLSCAGQQDKPSNIESLPSHEREIVDDLQDHILSLPQVAEPGGGLSVRTPRLIIRVVQARNLAAADMNGWSDPFCEVRVRGRKQRTRIVTKSVAPKWNQVFEFGAKDFLSEKDTVNITIFDKDVITNDKLGTLSIPIYQLTQQPCVPGEDASWFPLLSSKYSCAGEVQVSAEFVLPDFLTSSNQQAARDLYKGKEWLYELKLTLLSARGLAATNISAHTASTYCVISCGSEKGVKSRVRHDTTNPIWNQHFKFRRSIDSAREGLGRADYLTVQVMSESARMADSCIGKISFDLGYLLDKLGYVDKGGAELTDYFLLDPPDRSDDLQIDTDLAVEDDFGKESMGSPEAVEVNKASPLSGKAPPQGPSSEHSLEQDSSVSPRHRHSVRSKVEHIRAAILGRTSQHRTKSISSSTSLANVKEPRDSDRHRHYHVEEAIEALAGNHQNTGEADEPWGSVRMKICLVPIGEKRMNLSKKLLVRIRHVIDILSDDWRIKQDQVPRRVFLRMQLGTKIFESSEARLTPEFGCAVFNAQNILDYWGVRPELGLEALQIDLLDVNDGLSIAQAKMSMEELENLCSGASSSSKIASTQLEMTPVRFLNSSPKAVMDVRVLHVFEELRPVLGLFHLSLRSLKIRRDDFLSSYRTIVRYGDSVMTTKSTSGELSIKYPPSEATYKFAVYEMFTPVEIEVWAKPNDGHAGTLSNMGDDRKGISKWGKLIGSAELSMFDMLELEAQVIHSDPRMIEKVPMPRLKLPLMQGSKGKGSQMGSLWIEAMYEENFWALMAPNPNPKLGAPKPFSLANLRHEINRFVTIIGWLAYAQKGVAYLLDWKNYAVSIFSVFLVVLFCCIDFYAERVLAIPFYIALVIVMRKHHERTSGELVTNVLKEVQARESNARVRIAILEARDLMPVGVARSDRSQRGFYSSTRNLRDGQSTPVSAATAAAAVVLNAASTPFIEASNNIKNSIQDSKESCPNHTFSSFTKIQKQHSNINLQNSPRANEGQIYSTHEELSVKRDDEEFIEDIEAKESGTDFDDEQANNRYRSTRSLRDRVTANGLPKLSLDSFSSIDRDELMSPFSPIMSPTGLLQSRNTCSSKQLSKENVGILPRAYARVGLRTNFGDRTLFRIGTTWRSFPTRSPNFSKGKKGYSLSHTSKASLKSQIVHWEAENGSKVPAFQFDVKSFTKPGKLILVRLFRAEGLIARDRNGFSDPFVILQTTQGPPSSAGVKQRYGKKRNVDYDAAVVNTLGSFNESSVDAHHNQDLGTHEAVKLHNVAGTAGGKWNGVPAGNQVRSKVVQESLDPVWNQEFVLGGMPMVQNGDYVELVFQDADGAKKSEDLGLVRVKVSKIENMFGPLSNGPQWLYLSPPKDMAHASHDGPGKAGRVLVHMFVVDMSRSSGGLDLLRELNTCPLNVETTPVLYENEIHPNTSDENMLVSPDSWFRTGSEVVVEVFDDSLTSKDCSFLGCARVPLAALIHNDEELHQPVFERWLPLCPYMDGSRADVELNEATAKCHASCLGEVLVRVEVLLPDPQIRARQMELEEAKRADKARILARLRMLNRALADFQNRLYRFNNKMEHAKNLFNWTHPRRTQRVMNLLAILCVLCTVVPSRYVIMFVSLFMFTEHFRRMGTMALRFNHLLSAMPTDDDRREACSGGILAAKRRFPSTVSPAPRLMPATSLFPGDISAQGSPSTPPKLLSAAANVTSSPPHLSEARVREVNRPSAAASLDETPAGVITRGGANASSNDCSEDFAHGQGLSEQRAWAYGGAQVGQQGSRQDETGVLEAAGVFNKEDLSRGRAETSGKLAQSRCECDLVVAASCGTLQSGDRISLEKKAQKATLAIIPRILKAPANGFQLTAHDVDHGIAGSLRIMLAATSSVRLRGAAARKVRARWTTRYCFMLRAPGAIYLLWWPTRDAFEALDSPEGVFGPILAARSNLCHDDALDMGGCTRADLGMTLLREQQSTALTAAMILSQSRSGSRIVPGSTGARLVSELATTFASSSSSSLTTTTTTSTTTATSTSLSIPKRNSKVSSESTFADRELEQLLVLANSAHKTQQWLSCLAGAEVSPLR